MKSIYSFLLIFLFFVSSPNQAQNISAENVEYQILKFPKIQIEESHRQFKVIATSPYNLTAEDVIAQSKVDFDAELKNYDKVVADSETEFQNKLKDYDAEVANSKAKFELESAEFKKLSMLERLTLIDQHKNPRLVTPTKPVYYKPAKPTYHNPNLNDYIIINNNVLSTQVNINGFSREGNYVDIKVDIQKLKFQDNAGQTFANQPTKLIVKVNGAEKLNTSFFEDFSFVSASPSNNINRPLAEKNFLNNVIATVNQYLNDNFAYQTSKSSVTLLSVKNKGGKYDDLEKADIYISTNLRKLNPENAAITSAATTGMQKGIDIWKNTLTKIDYKDKKTDFNAKIAQMVYLNLMRLNLALNNKVEAEKYLNEMQENIIYMKLSYDEENSLKQIEKQIYKS